MTDIQEEVLEGVTLSKTAAERLLQILINEDGDYLRA